jgi:hypothetical protein
MMTYPNLPKSINEKVIEVSVEPDLTKLQPVIMMQPHELTKLLAQIEDEQKPWIVMRCKDAMYIVWNKLLYCFIDNV